MVHLLTVASGGTGAYELWLLWWPEELELRAHFCLQVKQQTGWKAQGDPELTSQPGSQGTLLSQLLTERGRGLQGI